MKKSKNKIKILLPIIFIIVVGVTFALLIDMKNKTEKVTNTNSASSTNIVNETDNNTNTNTDTNTNVVEENTVDEENTVVENTTVDNATKNEVVSDKNDKYLEDKQAKAIKIMKEHWGADDSVYFTNESAKSSEEYIVAVRSKDSTAVQNYFRVNIVTGDVEVEY